MHFTLELEINFVDLVPPGRGDPELNRGMLFISPLGVNFGFWSHLECSEKNANIFLTVKVLFRVACEENRG